MHVPFLSPVFFPMRDVDAELLRRARRHRAARSCWSRRRSIAPPSSRRDEHAAPATPASNLRLFYSGNLSQAALSDAPHDRRRRRAAGSGRVDFTAQVVGDPAAAIHQCGSRTRPAQARGRRSISSSASRRCRRCADDEDSRVWKGRLAAPANLKYVVQAVNGVGLVSLDDNRGAFRIASRCRRDDARARRAAVERDRRRQPDRDSQAHDPGAWRSRARRWPLAWAAHPGSV